MKKFIFIFTIYALTVSFQKASANICEMVFAKDSKSSLTVAREALDLGLANARHSSMEKPHHEIAAEIFNFIFTAEPNSTVKIFTGKIRRDGLSALLLTAMTLESGAKYGKNLNFEIYVSNTSNRLSLELITKNSGIKIFQTSDTSVLGKTRMVRTIDAGKTLEAIEFDANLNSHSLEGLDDTLRHAHYAQGKIEIPNFTVSTISAEQVTNLVETLARSYESRVPLTVDRSVPLREMNLINRHSNYYARLIYRAKFKIEAPASLDYIQVIKAVIL